MCKYIESVSQGTESPTRLHVALWRLVAASTSAQAEQSFCCLPEDIWDFLLPKTKTQMHRLIWVFTGCTCDLVVNAVHQSGYTVDSCYLEFQGTRWKLWDIRTSTYQDCRIEEKINQTTTFNKCIYVIGLLKFEIYWKYCGKEEKLAISILWKRGEIAPHNILLPVVRNSSLGRDQIFTLR